MEDVCFTIDDRQFISIVGPNGGADHPPEAHAGSSPADPRRIEVCGKTPVKARPCIGYMPQHLQFDPQFPVNVSDVVLMGVWETGHGSAHTAAAILKSPGRPCSAWR